MIIYKITNTINNKIYIGQTSKDDENYFGGGVIIKQAIKKHGKENFVKEILEHCNTIDELNEREIYWISFFDSTNHKIGYNIELGGRSKSHTTYTREKISSSKKGIKNTESHNKNIGLASSNRSEETHKKLSSSNKKWKIENPEKWKASYMKMQKTKSEKYWKSEKAQIQMKKLHQKKCKFEFEILQKTLSGEMIKSWKGLSEIRSFHPEWKSCSNIARIFNDPKRTIAYGYKWERA
jgi:group I intron endonuclease